MYHHVWGTSEGPIREATASVEALIAPLLTGGTPKVAKKFTVEKCEKHKVDWTAVLLRQKTAALTYAFRDGCDIEGTITPAVFTPFPVDLRLKNLDEYQRLLTQSKITTSIESRPVLLLELFEGQLMGARGTVKFSADYRVRMNPAASKQPVEENLGGELRISEIFGKKVQIKRRIKVE